MFCGEQLPFGWSVSGPISGLGCSDNVFFLILNNGAVAREGCGLEHQGFDSKFGQEFSLLKKINSPIGNGGYFSGGYIV
jgi:hypothetical protein